MIEILPFKPIERDAQQARYQLPLGLAKSTGLRTRLLPPPDLQLPNQAAAALKGTRIRMPLLPERPAWLLRQLVCGINPRAASTSEQFDVTERASKRDSAALRDAERIVFIGSTKTGRYSLLSQEE